MCMHTTRMQHDMSCHVTLVEPTIDANDTLSTDKHWLLRTYHNWHAIICMHCLCELIVWTTMIVCHDLVTLRRSSFRFLLWVEPTAFHVVMFCRYAQQCNSTWPSCMNPRCISHTNEPTSVSTLSLFTRSQSNTIWQSQTHSSKFETHEPTPRTSNTHTEHN